MPKKNSMDTSQTPIDLEAALDALSLDDLPVEDEPSRLLEDLPMTAERLASQLMGQFIYQVNRRLRELDARGDEPVNRSVLAERMDVSKSTVSRLLREESNPTLLTIGKAALALGLTEAVLKLIPEEEADHQVHEVKAFVESEEGQAPWWPLTSMRAHQEPITMRMEPSLPGMGGSGPLQTQGPMWLLRSEQRASGVPHRSPYANEKDRLTEVVRRMMAPHGHGETAGASSVRVEEDYQDMSSTANDYSYAKSA